MYLQEKIKNKILNLQNQQKQYESLYHQCAGGIAAFNEQLNELNKDDKETKQSNLLGSEEC